MIKLSWEERRPRAPASRAEQGDQPLVVTGEGSISFFISITVLPSLSS